MTLSAARRPKFGSATLEVQHNLFEVISKTNTLSNSEASTLNITVSHLRHSYLLPSIVSRSYIPGSSIPKHKLHRDHHRTLHRTHKLNGSTQNTLLPHQPPSFTMVSPTAIKTLAKELLSLSRTPPSDIRIVLSDSDLLSFTAYIRGPPSTPYSSGYFRISFDFTDSDFPNTHPICKFATPIFHPNVSRSGEVCVSSLKKDWKKEYGIERILVTIKCLLIEPNADSALDAEASRLMQEDWAAYEETARLWTRIHAAKKPACFEGDVEVEGSTAVKDSTALKPTIVKATSCSASAPQPITPQMRARPAVSLGPKRGLRRL